MLGLYGAGGGRRPSTRGFFWHTESVKLIVSIVAALALAASATAAVQAKPSVHVTPGETALAVSGQGFKAGEKVSVMVFHGGVRAVRNVTATANGAFRFRLSMAVVDECLYSYVHAKGNKGSRASSRNMPGPCGPPIQP